MVWIWDQELKIMQSFSNKNITHDYAYELVKCHQQIFYDSTDILKNVLLT